MSPVLSLGLCADADGALIVIDAASKNFRVRKLTAGTVGNLFVFFTVSSAMDAPYVRVSRRFSLMDVEQLAIHQGFIAFLIPLLHMGGFRARGVHDVTHCQTGKQLNKTKSDIGFNLCRT